jgi:subtilase family serine protease
MHRIVAVSSMIGVVALGMTAVLSGNPAGASVPRALPAVQQACSSATAGRARCLSERITEASAPLARPSHNAPEFYGPADLQSAYELATASATRGAGETVAIVDAGGDPDIISNLNSYRAYYHLPALKAGQFKQYNESGHTSPLPPVAPGWTVEESLDVDMVSAICPRCNIALMEASSNSFADLGVTVDSAAHLSGVVAISNSYGASEFSEETSLDHYYDHPGVAVTASAGDSGYGTGYPAASRYVVAVGGTHLVTSGTARGWTETVWGPSKGYEWGTGSGCSSAEAKPSWQVDHGCYARTMNDVSANADPFTGVCIWDTYDSSVNPYCGWGGTSESSPIIAATYALAGRVSATVPAAEYPYLHRTRLHDVTAGSDLLGGSCFPALLCHGEVGYDAPTGNGTPDGYTAF